MVNNYMSPRTAKLPVKKSIQLLNKCRIRVNCCDNRLTVTIPRDRHREHGKLLFVFFAGLFAGLETADFVINHFLFFLEGSH